MKRAATFGAWMLAAAAVVYTGAAVTSPPGALNEFRGYATGTAVHVDGLQTATAAPPDPPTATRVVDGEIAVAGAAVDRRGFTGPIFNEMDQAITPQAELLTGPTTTMPSTTTTTGSPIPTLPSTTTTTTAPSTTSSTGPTTTSTSSSTTTTTAPLPPAEFVRMAAGRGMGLELGLGTTVPNDNANTVMQPSSADDNPQRAEATAPPSTPLITRQVGPVPAPPVAYASLLRGQAQAIYTSDPCDAVTPRGFGLGYAADVQLLNSGADNEDGSFQTPTLAVDAQDPDRSASQSVSRTFLEPKTDGTYAMVSETRQTIAPITIGKDDLNPANDTTIEVLGEWVLRVVATGDDGGATVHYGPDPETSPETPILRVKQPGEVIETQISFQDFQEGGIIIPANPVANIAIGESPRKIQRGVTPVPADPADPATLPLLDPEGTEAAAAADVVRVHVLTVDPLEPGTAHATDLRVGHMEGAVKVPKGGIRMEQCATTTTPSTTTTTAATTTTTGATTTSSSTSSSTSTSRPTTTTSPSSTTTTTRPLVTVPTVVTTTTTRPTVQGQPPQAKPAVPVVAQPRFTG